MVRKIALLFFVWLFACVTAFSATTEYPNGITTATKAQKQNADITPGDGDIYITGNAEVDGITRLDGDVTINADVTMNGVRIEGSETVYRVTYSSDITISPTYSFEVVACTETAITSTALPSIATTTFTNYSRLRIYVSSNSFTLQDNDSVSGTLVELFEATTLTLAKGEWCDFFYLNGKWYQDGFPHHTTGNITTVGTAGLGATTVTSMLTSDGKYGYTDAAGNTNYFLTLSTTLVLDAGVFLDFADGKAGSFKVKIGTNCVEGSFTSAAAVTICTVDGAAPTYASTTLTNDGTVNIGDGGTVVEIRNKQFESAVTFIECWFIN